MLFAAAVAAEHRPACSVPAHGGYRCKVQVWLHRDRKSSVKVKAEKREIVICRSKSPGHKIFETF